MSSAVMTRIAPRCSTLPRRSHRSSARRASESTVDAIYGGAWKGPVFVLTHHPDDAPETESVTFQGSDAAEAVRIELQAWNPGQAPAVARRISATRSGCSRAAKCPVLSSAIEWASGSSARLASRSGARDQS